MVQRLGGFNDDLMLSESFNERMYNDNMQIIQDLSKELEKAAELGFEIIRYEEEQDFKQ